jgi:tetratricopeptide (TPR) repeat protein
LDIGKSFEAVKAALEVDDLPTAVREATEAVNGGAQNGLFFNLAAYGLQLQRRYDEALELLNRALRLTPEDPLLWNAVGQLQLQQGKASDAVVSFQKALIHDSRLAPAHNGLGLAFEILGDLEFARLHQERAVRYAPNFADPLGSLAVLAVMRKANDEGRAFAERALAIDPFQSAAILSLATIELQEESLDSAEQRLRALIDHGSLTPLHESSAQKLLGDVLDARGAAHEAIGAYARGNALSRGVYLPQLEAAGIESGVDLTHRLARYFSAASAKSWSSAPAVPEGEGTARHVFMIGFYRSGTTLLEQVLASHAEVVTLEEKPALDELAWDFFQNDEGLDSLSNLTRERAEELRTEYWRKVRSYGVEPGEGVFVDKLPLGGLWAPFIAKVFPTARLLVVRRDPRDVVLSCFRHRFLPTSLPQEFTDIRRAAMLYDGVMALFEIYQAKLSLNVQICRHEDLVADFDESVGEICSFLQIPWREEMRDFAEVAKNRDIRTPSARQVVRGLYASGIGQWRAYAPAMPEALEILAPWVEKFGYEPA